MICPDRLQQSDFCKDVPFILLPRIACIIYIYIISYNYCQCHCLLQHCIDVIFYDQYITYQINIQNGSMWEMFRQSHRTQRHSQVRAATCFIYISISRLQVRSKNVFGAFSLPAPCLILHCRCRAAFSRKKFGEAQESLRRLLAGQHISSWGFQHWLVQLWCSHNNNNLNILFGQNMKWFTRHHSGQILKKTHLHDSHVSSLKQPGGGRDDIVINVVWHDQELSINQYYSVISSKKGEAKYGLYMSVVFAFSIA